MKKIVLGLFFFAVVPFSLNNVYAFSFSSNDTGTDIGANLDLNYEPSGVVWHQRLQSLFTIWDNGYVTQMDIDGNIIYTSVFVGGDLEGVAVVDDQSNYIYLLVEYPQKIVEFDISTWTRTGRSWTLQGMAGNSASGAEALTYNQKGGVFYVGSQYDGQIYVYNIDLSVSGIVANSSVIATGVNTDLAGLSYSAETGITYAVFDAGNIIQEYDENGALLAQYSLPGHDQEGIAVLPGCPNNSTVMIIAEDSGRMMKYGDYPINCEIPVPEWSQIYDYESLIPYTNTEVRDDYHVFDNKSEFSYFRIAAQSVAGWYSFELDSKATTLDALYGLGIYVRNAEGRFTETREINDLNWKKYQFYYYIPANTPTEVRLISGVRGTDSAGVKREHHLRTVKVTRVEEALDYMNLPVITNLTVEFGLRKVILTVDTNMEASTKMLFNGTWMTDTNLATSKTRTIKNLNCGTAYNYEIRLFSDLYSFTFDNVVTQVGTVSTAACR